MEINIVKEIKLFQCGEFKGKPSGDINYKVLVDGLEKGNIFHCGDKRYQVMSKRILGEYKAKYFKTFNGAKKFLLTAKERFIPLGEALNKHFGSNYVV